MPISFDYELGRTDPSHCGYDAVQTFLDFLISNSQLDEIVEIEIRLHTSSGYGASRMAQLIRDRQSLCEEADEIRRKLLARMSGVSEFMKAVKQRFSVWFNRSHQRYGTLVAERFKSVLVEGQGRCKRWLRISI